MLLKNRKRYRDVEREIASEEGRAKVCLLVLHLFKEAGCTSAWRARKIVHHQEMELVGIHLRVRLHHRRLFQ